MHRSTRLATVAMIVSTALFAQAQAVGANAEVVAALKKGGAVVLMRHGSAGAGAPPGQMTPGAARGSSAAAPAAGIAQPPADPALNDKGRASAQAVHDALQSLQVKFATANASPTRRAQQTAEIVSGVKPAVLEALAMVRGNAGATPMLEWLKSQVMHPPKAGNVLAVSHGPNLQAILPADAAPPEEAEALVLVSDGQGGLRILGRVKAEEWTTLAAR